jgi:hypothetical protein
MPLNTGTLCTILLSIPGVLAAASANDPTPPQIPLTVPAGAPLRLYLTKRVPKRECAQVEAKVLDPVYGFDHEVIPAGSVVLGHVTRLQPVSRGEHIYSILGGDFTPLHTAPVEFTTLILPDGRRLQLRTKQDVGLNSIFSPKPAGKAKAGAAANTGVLGMGRQKVEDAIHGEIDRARSIPGIVRSPDKKEKAEEYLMAKLPYHPQYLRKGLRFDSELAEPLRFGSETVPVGSLAELGTQPPADAVARARLITPLSSASSRQGQTVEAVLSQPVFSASHKLVLPEGTRLEGTVVAARAARWFHRGGQLRFTFKEMELPEEALRLEETTAAASAAPSADAARPAQQQLKVRTEANLENAESPSKTPIKVNGEGGVETKESKTRFLAAAAAVMIARSAGDNDPIRNHNHQIIGQSQNVGGRTVGGAFGFGLLGAAISQSSRWVGTAFGYYGMASSLFSTLIARGSEVQFGRDAMIDIRFDTRQGPAAANQAPAK